MTAEALRQQASTLADDLERLQTFLAEGWDLPYLEASHAVVALDKISKTVRKLTAHLDGLLPLDSTSNGKASKTANR